MTTGRRQRHDRASRWPTSWATNAAVISLAVAAHILQTYNYTHRYLFMCVCAHIRVRPPTCVRITHIRMVHLQLQRQSTAESKWDWAYAEKIFALQPLAPALSRSIALRLPLVKAFAFVYHWVLSRNRRTFFTDHKAKRAQFLLVNKTLDTFWFCPGEQCEQD